MTDRVIDCVVFSGGGAKGAYGAGVALALERYRKIKKVNSEICWIGASAGALNAAVMAMSDASTLIAFWKEMSTRKVLNVWIKWQKFNMSKRWLLHKMPGSGPYSVYPNKGLRKILEERVNYQGLTSSHLIVAATNYTTGQLKSFVHSPFLESFLLLDNAEIAENRRLKSWTKLVEEEFVDVLLASCAIPICFPP